MKYLATVRFTLDRKIEKEVEAHNIQMASDEILKQVDQEFQTKNFIITKWVELPQAADTLQAEQSPS